VEAASSLSILNACGLDRRYEYNRIGIGQPAATVLLADLLGSDPAVQQNGADQA